MKGACAVLVFFSVTFDGVSRCVLCHPSFLPAPLVAAAASPAALTISSSSSQLAQEYSDGIPVHFGHGLLTRGCSTVDLMMTTASIPACLAAFWAEECRHGSTDPSTKTTDVIPRRDSPALLETTSNMAGRVQQTCRGSLTLVILPPSALDKLSMPG